MLKAQRALISVFDKRGVVDLGRGLHRLGVEIVSTGGTAEALAREGVPIVRVSEATGVPEMLDGRVKTLHPRIHGGILADRSKSSHLAELTRLGIPPIDLVVVNLYPFYDTARSGASFEEVVEMIDIGGPAMIRAAAKNHRGVAVVVDPDDYPQVLAALEDADGVVPGALRRRLAIKAFRHTQTYDAEIAGWLERESGDPAVRFPDHLILDLKREMEPRYGENPHQAAALYRVLGGPGVLDGYEQLQGKELSFNNFLDADAARRIVALYEEPAVAIVKHNNPCGVGVGGDPVEAYTRALACDPQSAFGSVVALNRPADRELAAALASLFVEVVVAPEFSPEAARAFAEKKRLRLLRCPPPAPSASDLDLRPVAGGFLAQEPDEGPVDPGEWTCPTRRQPSDEELRGLVFVWRAVRGVKSNAIVVGNEHQTLGIGAGQMSRVDSCRLAVEKAQSALTGAVAASDAFFPFRDGLDVLAEAGVTAVVQPGGSRRDAEVVAAADERRVAMMLTGRRHFRH
ncbi:MAG: bifunctional phosphoribosylaminoimidazolecarboxamide formyltransferase/IMP cyclohydrolase [Thermoanaerobaculia bacterium]|nr:bifunctional phosphoribosylaminoimidazolecarboxamide formyltransferase/IMP cyclohydrolase [Thermoanaerobaculia bacterium]